MIIKAILVKLTDSKLSIIFSSNSFKGCIWWSQLLYTASPKSIRKRPQTLFHSLRVFSDKLIYYLISSFVVSTSFSYSFPVRLHLLEIFTIEKSKLFSAHPASMTSVATCIVTTLQTVILNRFWHCMWITLIKMWIYMNYIYCFINFHFV